MASGGSDRDAVSENFFAKALAYVSREATDMNGLS